MKPINFLVLACLVSAPVFAQTAPDEINYGPYQSRYENLERQTSEAAEVLQTSRTNLAQAQKFISEMTAHIAGLESDIGQSQGEIARIKQLIPQLEQQAATARGEDARVQADLRTRQNEESNLQNRLRQEQSQLRPMEEVLARKEAQVRVTQNELASLQQRERDVTARMNLAVNSAANVDRQIESERAQQRQMRDDLRNFDARIAALQADVTRHESEVATLNSNLSSERAKLGALNTRVSEYQAEVAKLRAANAPADQIATAERKLSAASGTRDNTANGIRDFEAKVAQADAAVRSTRADLDQQRRNQGTLPTRISASEAREQQLTGERNARTAEAANLRNELNVIQQSERAREVAISNSRQDMQSDVANIARQRQLIDNIAQQIASTRGYINDLVNRDRTLSAQIAQLSQDIQQNQASIPQLEASIRNNQTEIAKGRQQLVTAREDERNLTQAIVQQESNLSRVTADRDNAEGQMSQRVNLYQRYLQEARQLGVNQTAVATGLGNKEGDKMSQILSHQNGEALGKQLGMAEARLWANVRGEVQGYEAGYAEGIRSVADIQRANAEAVDKGTKDAELFAQTNFKPAFFEEILVAELKKPLQIKKGLMKMMGIPSSISEMYSLEGQAAVSPISPEELQRSKVVKTMLDELINNMEKDLTAVEVKARDLARADLAFDAPSKIPYGQVNCTQVYKNVAAFKAACDSSYKESFSNLFVEGARDTFGQSYTQSYEKELSRVELTQREALYPTELATATKVGTSEGLKVGKIDIYNQTFASTYKRTYDSQLPVAREKSKVDADMEVKQWIATKPTLTIASSRLEASDFRGGEEVTVKAAVKNISSVALAGPVVVKITSLENADAVSGQAVLNAAGGLSVTDLPDLKLKISASAKTGQKLVVKGTVDLPGDRYKPARQEKFMLEQVLSANPAHDLANDFLKYPKIKGVFRRNTHYFTATISPNVEDVVGGYQVTLKPVAASASLIEMNSTDAATGAMKLGEKKDLEFSYSFPNEAKGETVTLELNIIYANKVIKKEMIELFPN